VSYADVLHLVYKGVEKVRFSNIDGDIWQSSDLRLKRDIQNFETALPRLMKLEAKSYHYKDNEDGTPLSYGFIAQEVEKIFPGAVSSLGKDGMKAIAYQKLNILAIKSIQEQQVIIEAQQKEIDLLKQQNNGMGKAIEKLQEAVEEIKQAK
ncbi:MAG: tail fiber domain-containing protein, partial [Ferruginibacter sp.]